MKTFDKEGYRHIVLVGFVPTTVIWLVAGIIYFFAHTIPIVSDKHKMPFSIYTDQELQGNSVASATEAATQGIDFSYILKAGYPYPYAGVCFSPASGLLNIKPNSNFEVAIKTEPGRVIPFVLNEQIKGVYGKEILRPVVYELKTQADVTLYTLSLESFAVPSWWYKANHLSETDLPPFNAANVKNICVQNSFLSPLNKEEKLHILHIKNTPDMSFWIWFAAIFSVCWSGGYAAYLLLKKKKTAVFIPYIATYSDEEPKDEWARVRNYIAVNYMNEIDMESIEKELGIARHRVAQLIKENTTLIFKQYLNQIKVAEAKRLLQETNLPIGEIADQAGFGHVSNFNRVFRQYTGESPSDLRSKISLK